MFDSIHIGMRGLQAFSSGLKVISNNVTNLNTPGFKASNLSFSSLYYQPGSGAGGGAGFSFFGTGVLAGQTFVDFKAGDTRQTGNALDLSIDGEGYFVTRDPDGTQLRYSRAGQFEFDKDGVLVVRGSKRQVMGLGGGGQTSNITLNGLRINAPKPTAKVTLTGNLSSGSNTFTLDAVKVIDIVGGEHQLKLVFTAKTDVPGAWSVSVTDAGAEVGAGEVRFNGGIIDANFSKFTFSYGPAGVTASDVTVDLSSQVTSFNSGTISSLSVASTDGHAVGSVTKISFDAQGKLQLTYSNGETTTGGQLAMALFENPGALIPAEGGEFSNANASNVRLGAAGSTGFGSLVANQVEGSNVDLSAEFSDLIVMQRGYQAASRVVSTANDMLQELFDMKGSR